MKGRITLVVTNIVMLALGVVLVAFCNDARMAELIAIALGVLFLAPSLFSLIMLLFTNVPESEAMHNPRYNLVPTIGGLSFGLVIVLRASEFVGLLKYLFAILLIAGGLYYVFYIVFSRSTLKMPKWYYFLPSVVTLAGIVALVLPIEDNALIFFITGVSLIALSVTSIVISYSEYMAARAAAKEAAATAAAATPAEEVKAEVVEQQPTDVTVAGNEPEA